jgi:two-component system, NtrC family, sensor histidine kinase AtoS
MAMKDLEALYLSLQEKVKELTLKLSQTNATLNSVVTHLSHGLILVRPNGLIEIFNPALTQITKINSLECIGRDYRDFFDETFFGFSIQEAFSNPSQSFHALITFNEYELDISASNVVGEGLIILIQDCTATRRLQMAVEQNERLAALGEMGATLAHEIRNPLGGIQGFASLLKEELKEESHQRQLGYIIEGTKILNSLVTNVLDYARPLCLNFTRIDLVEVIEKARFLFEGKCQIHLQKPKVWISGDKERLCGAFLNLFRNSQEAGSEVVDVDISSTGEIKISDHGCGISSEQQTKIFTPFFTTKTTGTGLGLPEVKKVIQAHGGNISILSSAPEKGTTFSISLPKAEK